MGTKSREVIYGGRARAAKMNAERARKLAVEAVREADRAEAHAWSIRIEGFGGPAQPSPTIGQCLNGGYGWLEVKCRRCETRVSLPLDAIRRPRDTPDMEVEGGAEMPVVQDNAIFAARAYDQVDPDPRDRTLHLGASGR
jgi:hypothetical protein